MHAQEFHAYQNDPVDAIYEEDLNGMDNQSDGGMMEKSQDDQSPNTEDEEEEEEDESEGGKTLIRRIEDVFIQPNDFIFENTDKGQIRGNYRIG